MAARKNERKLSRRYAFLKRRLLRLPQAPHAIEVDFCPLPDIVEGEYGFWLGLVASRQEGSMLMHTIDKQPPDLEEIENLLAAAIDCPHTTFAAASRRPLCGMILNGREWRHL